MNQIGVPAATIEPIIEPAEVPTMRVGLHGIPAGFGCERLQGPGKPGAALNSSRTEDETHPHRGRKGTRRYGRQAFEIGSRTCPWGSSSPLPSSVLVAAWAVWTYNRLVALRLACESSWSQIDVALRLRHDLVPRLAEVVAGYAGHERATFENVSAAQQPGA